MSDRNHTDRDTGDDDAEHVRSRLACQGPRRGALVKSSDGRINPGVWRGVHGALLDDPDFQLLSSQARLGLLVCRLCTQNTRASIFRWYADVLVAQTGLRSDELEAVLQELESKPNRAKPWIVRDRQVLWIRNGLRFDPTMTLSNPNHRLAVLRVLASLPSGSQVVRKFRRYYHLADGSHPPSHGASHPPGDHPSHQGYTSTSSTPNSKQSTSPRGEPEGGERPEDGSSGPPLIDAVREGGRSNNKADTNGHHRRPAPGEYQEILTHVKASRPSLSRQEAEALALRLLQETLKS